MKGSVTVDQRRLKPEQAVTSDRCHSERSEESRLAKSNRVGFLRPKSGLRKDMLGFMRYCENRRCSRPTGSKDIPGKSSGGRGSPREYARCRKSKRRCAQGRGQTRSEGRCHSGVDRGTTGTNLLADDFPSSASPADRSREYADCRR